MLKHKILIVDDEEDIGLLIQGLLEDEGYEAIVATNSTQAYTLIEQTLPDLVIQDIWLQGSTDDGLDILKNMKESHPNLPFVMISGHGTIETAVSAIKSGAYDFIEKPFKSDRLLLMVQRVLENSALKKQNAELKLRTTQSIVHLAKQIPDSVLNTLDKVAATNGRLFITGETGTGKRIAAQYVHEKSTRKEMPFMTLNCASMNPEKLEATLFGIKGNPLSGESSKQSLLDLVDGGTLLLDEVLSLPKDLQGKVLMLLQESAYYITGSNIKKSVNIRVIATSSENIEQKIADGIFREDLYYRLNVVPIHLPPLKKRKQDIPSLIAHNSRLEFSKSALDKLQSYSWPGNIKQLHNVLEWIAIMLDDTKKTVEIEDLPPELGGHARPQAHQNKFSIETILGDVLHMALRDARESFERYYLLSQVEKFDGNISKTAEFIGMERSALHRKLKSLDVFSNDKQNVA